MSMQMDILPESALGLADRGAAVPLVVALGAVRVPVAEPFLLHAVPAAPTAVRAVPVHAGAVLLVRPVAAVREPVANATPRDATPSGGG